MTDNIIKQPPLPDTIHFNHTMDNDKTEVMRITRDGVWVNPDMQVDETAKAVLDALDSQVKVLVQRAVEAEREKVAKWMMVQGYATGHGDTVEDLLKELGWQVAPVDAVNMMPDRVDETVKNRHEPYGYVWTSLRDGMEVRFSRMPPNKFYNPQNIKPVYTAPPNREWVGLTDEEIYDYADKFLYQHGSNFGIKSFGKAIEAKLKEKNGG